MKSILRTLVTITIIGVAGILPLTSTYAQRVFTDTKEIYPLEEYQEPRVGAMPDKAEWRKIPNGLNLTWASRDVHYKLHDVPNTPINNSATIRVWRGERANILALLYSKRNEGMLRVRMTGWHKDGSSIGIPAEARFVNYVITDDYKACGDHPTDLEAWLVPDVIDIDKPHRVPAMETRPVWCIIEAPYHIVAGEYETELEVLNEKGKVINSLKLRIVVDEHQLPEVDKQRFHLDVWQQPYAVSRYHNVERWSNEHIEALKPYLHALARAGQSTVSTILFYEPWGMQTHEPDRFEPMVETFMTREGEWRFDYTIFDRYVELCAECGISRQISCFSMVLWDMKFRFYDEASASYKFMYTSTATPEYRNLWQTFLASFKAHLQEKGWFDKTHIAMDERSEEDMHNAYNIAHAMGFKVSLAGNYHASLVDKLDNFSIAYGQVNNLSPAELKHRKEQGMITTYYTCCADKEPNIYSNSLPAEAAFIPLYAAAANLDGYLHWSWINWDETPLFDTRYRLFGAGDTYFYYPGNRSSVRFERLIEGIQQYEKIIILREELKDDPENLALLDALLEDIAACPTTTADYATAVDNMEQFLNGGYNE